MCTYNIICKVNAPIIYNMPAMADKHEVRCLIVEPNSPECDVTLFAVPLYLVTTEVREAFLDGVSPSDLLAEEDMLPEDNPEDYKIHPALIPLRGKIECLGIGVPSHLFLEYSYGGVLTLQPYSLF